MYICIEFVPFCYQPLFCRARYDSHAVEIVLMCAFVLTICEICHIIVSPSTAGFSKISTVGQAQKYAFYVALFFRFSLLLKWEVQIISSCFASTPLIESACPYPPGRVGSVRL